MIYNSVDCLKWIKETYNVDYHDRFGIVDLVFEYVKIKEAERQKEWELYRS